jgi:hypothetical protein
MMTTEYPGEMDHLVYSLFSAPGLTTESAAALAKSIRFGRYFPSAPERYAKAIEQALAQPESITAGMRPPYSEAEVRAFLGLVRKQLQ